MVSISGVPGIASDLQLTAGAEPVGAPTFDAQLAQLQRNDTGTPQIKKNLDGLVTVGVAAGTKLRPANQGFKVEDLEPGFAKEILQSLGYDLENHPDLPKQLSWVLSYDEYDYQNTPFDNLAGNVFAGFKPVASPTLMWFAGVDPNEVDALVEMYGFSGGNARDDMYKSVVANEVSAKLLVSQFPSITRLEAELLSEKVSLDVSENAWLSTFDNAFSRDPTSRKHYDSIGRVTAVALVQTMEQHGIESQVEQDKLAPQLIDSVTLKPGVLQRFKDVLKSNNIAPDQFIEDFKVNLNVAMQEKATEIQTKLLNSTGQ